MSRSQPTTSQLIDTTSDLVRLIDRYRAEGVIDLSAYRLLDRYGREAARLACRMDAERRASIGLLTVGRVPRDVAAVLLLSPDDDGPVAA